LSAFLPCLREDFNTNPNLAGISAKIRDKLAMQILRSLSALPVLLARIRLHSSQAGQGGVPTKDERRRESHAPSSLSVKTAKRLDGSTKKRRAVFMAESSEPGNGKSRKRAAVKPAARPAVSKVKSTIHLSLEASQRLDIHATMMGFDRSALVEKLINDHLRRYVVSDRSRGDDAASGEAAA
jgi:hypothetical protein